MKKRDFLYLVMAALNAMWIAHLVADDMTYDLKPTPWVFVSAAILSAVVTLDWLFLRKDKPEPEKSVVKVDEKETPNLPTTQLNNFASFYAGQFEKFATRTGEEMKALHKRCDELQLRCNSLQTQVTDLHEQNRRDMEAVQPQKRLGGMR